jgi:excisionase family DNA binding protein
MGCQGPDREPTRTDPNDREPVSGDVREHEPRTSDLLPRSVGSAGRRGHLRRWEAAFVLGCSEHEVARSVRRGALSTIRVGRHLRIAVEAVQAMVADQSLRVALLEAIADGRLEAPRAPSPSQVPPSYFELPDVVRARVWENRC